MNPATGPHGTPRKRPAATAEPTEMLVEGDLVSDGEASASYDGGSDDEDDDDDSGSGLDESDVDSDDEEDVDLSELNERHEELTEVKRALTRVAETLELRLHQTRDVASLNSHFRAALQKTVKMHHRRRRHYENVIEKLDLHRSHLDQRRRDLGYESEHG